MDALVVEIVGIENGNGTLEQTENKDETSKIETKYFIINIIFFSVLSRQIDNKSFLHFQFIKNVI